MRQFALTDGEQRLRGVHWCTPSLTVQRQQISPTFLHQFPTLPPFQTSHEASFSYILCIQTLWSRSPQRSTGALRFQQVRCLASRHILETCRRRFHRNLRRAGTYLEAEVTLAAKLCRCRARRVQTLL